MTLIKVLGIGSPFGDDQVGWKIAEALKQQDGLPSTVIIESHDRPGARLIDFMGNAELVFLIDAVQTGQEIGTVHRFENNEIDEIKNMISTHDMGIAQALQLGRALDVLPEQVVLYGVEIGPVTLDFILSEPIKRAIYQAVTLLTIELINYSFVPD